MANQDNFKTQVVDVNDSKILASRIIEEDTREILLEYLPASVGYDPLDNIELHFYSFPANNLYLSTVVNVTDDEIIKSHVVSYADDTFKNYIRIDFTKLFEKNNLTLIPGDYRITINFFSDEIGSYNDRVMYLDKISPNRTEVQLGYFNSRDIEVRRENENILREFVLPSFSRVTAIGVAEKIFRSGVVITGPNGMPATQWDIENTPIRGITYSKILENIGVPGVGQTETNTISRIRRLGASAELEFSTQLEEFLPKLYTKIREEIVKRGDKRIQEDEFKEFIEEAVDSEIIRLQEVVDRRISIT